MSFLWTRMVEDPAHIPAARDAGFDRVQLRVDQIMQLGQDDFESLKSSMATLGIQATVCSGILPPDVVVSEAGFNLYIWAQYLQEAVNKLSQIGCSRLAWSNGRARILPWEENVDTMKVQVMQFLYTVCDICEHYGMKVLIEPLSPKRTNFLNTMEQTDEFIGTVGKENLSSMVSLRDLTSIGLTNQSLIRWEHRLEHIHLENPEQSETVRKSPRRDDGYDYLPFLDALRKIGYDGTVSLPSDATADTLQYCRGL